MNHSPGDFRETILVVDDNRFILDLIVTILKKHRFRVFSAISGPAALEVAAKEPIDLLLSDVEMPLMTGPELGRRLQRLNPALSVMLMSGGTKGHLLAGDGWGFLAKPFSPTNLVGAVMQFLHGRNRNDLYPEAHAISGQA